MMETRPVGFNHNPRTGPNRKRAIPVGIARLLLVLSVVSLPPNPHMGFATREALIEGKG